MRSSECDGIILAAGMASRMGGEKLLYDIDGEPLVRHAVRNALDACARVIVVVGHGSDVVGEAIGDLDRFRLIIAHNSRYRSGMLGSIQTGMQHVSSRWFFVVPGDMPEVVPRIYAAVSGAIGESEESEGPAEAGESSVRAVVPYYRGTRGHPVLIHMGLIAEVLAEPPDGGPMRALIERHPVRRIEPEEPAITLDVDTEEDYRAYLERFNRGDLSSG